MSSSGSRRDEARAAVRRVADLDRAAVGLRDRADDRQAEAAAAAGAGGVGRALAADEAAEDLVAHLGRDPGAVVGDLDHRVIVLALRQQPDGRALGRVAGGVLEQVQDEPVELVGVALDREPGGEVDLELAPVQQRLDLVARGFGDLRQVDVGVGGAAAGVGAGEEEQVGDEARHAPGGAEGGVDRVAVVLGRAREGRLEELEVRLHAGERGAQLVRCVGDELPLAVERLLARRALGVERLEHPVHRPGELADLVVGGLDRHPARGVAGGGDVAGERGEAGDRLHRAVRDREPGEQREQRADGDAGEQEEVEPGDRGLDVGVRPRVLDEEGGAAAGDRLGRDAQVAAVGDLGLRARPGGDRGPRSRRSRCRRRRRR